MNNKSINIAVLGLGYMGKSHVRVLSSMEFVNLVAVCDIDEQKTGKIAKQYKLRSYNNFKKLIAAEKLDAVSVCLPTKLHLSASAFALSRKIAVFVEKPICATVSEGKKLISVAFSEKRPLMVGHIERFNPVVREIKQRIKTGELGKIYQIHTQRVSPPLDFGETPVSVDLATHDIDIMLYISGQEPERIYAEGLSKLIKNNDSIIAMMRFKNGLVGLIEASWLYPIKRRTLSVLGEKGLYVADYITQELFFYKRNKLLFRSNSYLNYQTSKADVVKIAFDWREPLQLELESFIDALRFGRKMPVTGLEALRALAIAHLFEKSSHEHRVV